MSDTKLYTKGTYKVLVDELYEGMSKAGNGFAKISGTVVESDSSEITTGDRVAELIMLRTDRQKKFLFARKKQLGLEGDFKPRIIEVHAVESAKTNKDGKPYIDVEYKLD